jgi:hypothetical protein
MRIVLGWLLSLLATLACAEHYGAPITSKRAQSLESALRQLSDQNPADVLVEAKVGEVCQVKGCWLGLKDASEEIHVTFANDSFFVPPSLMGKTVLAQGKLAKISMTLEQTKQHVKDAGGDPATVTQPGVRYTFVASGIEVKT